MQGQLLISNVSFECFSKDMSIVIFMKLRHFVSQMIFCVTNVRFCGVFASVIGFLLYQAWYIYGIYLQIFG